MEIDTFKFKEDGVVLNSDPPTPDSPFVDVTRIEGLSNAPYRTTERDREGMDGGFIDVVYEKIRPIIIEGTVFCPADTLESFLGVLKANFAPTKASFPFHFQPSGVSERVVFCKSYGIKYDWDTARRIGTTEVQIQLMAEDPTIYAAEPLQAGTTLPSDTSGRAYDKEFNYGYTETIPGTVPQTGGVAYIVNSGNKETGASITIYGPIDNPGVTHDVTGRDLQFNLSLAAGQYLTIDLRARTVLLNGTSSRRHTLSYTSRWFLLPPGDNGFRLLGSDPIGGAPDPTMTIIARSAYR